MAFHGKYLGETIAALGVWYALLSIFIPRNSEAIPIAIRSLVSQNLSIALAVVLALPLLTAFIRGKLSLFRGQLDFNLNGVYHIAPKGRSFTHWSNVMSVETTYWFKGIRLSKENGDYFDLYVPSTHRDCLIKLIKRLIVYHQSDSLIGRVSVDYQED